MGLRLAAILKCVWIFKDFIFMQPFEDRLFIPYLLYKARGAVWCSTMVFTGEWAQELLGS